MPKTSVPDSIISCVKRCKPLLDVTGLITATAAVIIAWKTDTSFRHQTELLEIETRIAQNDLSHRARDEFDQAIDEASRFCPTCTHCAPAYAIQIPLAKALTREPEAAAILSAGEYNRFAMLGSSVWDFKKTESFVKKAMEKSGEPFDRFFSNLLLGHLNYTYAESDPASASIQVGDVGFTTAVGCLQPQQAKPAVRSLMGQAYGLWAIHKRFRKDKAKSDEYAELARAFWKNLPDAGLLDRELDDQLAAAADGTRPEIACLFRSADSCVGMPTRSYPAPAPAPAPTPAPRPPTAAPVPAPAPESAPVPSAPAAPAPPAPPRAQATADDTGVATGDVPGEGLLPFSATATSAPAAPPPPKPSAAAPNAAPAPAPAGSRTPATLVSGPSL